MGKEFCEARESCEETEPSSEEAVNTCINATNPSSSLCSKILTFFFTNYAQASEQTSFLSLPTELRQAILLLDFEERFDTTTYGAEIVFLKSNLARHATKLRTVYIGILEDVNYIETKLRLGVEEELKIRDSDLRKEWTSIKIQQWDARRAGTWECAWELKLSRELNRHKPGHGYSRREWERACRLEWYDVDWVDVLGGVKDMFDWVEWLEIGELNGVQSLFEGV